MKRSLTLTLMAIAGTAILAIALIGFRLSQGGVDYSAYAHVVDVNGDTSVTTADVHLEIDMDVTDGNPCNPVDATLTTVVGGPDYEVAVCLTSSAGEPNAFNFDLVYDDSLNTCVPGATHEDPDNPGSFLPCAETDSNCLDYNPDANAGTTIFSTPGLGQNMYDCSASGGAPPVCDENTGAHGAGAGRAYIGCFTTKTPTLPIGATVSAPLAEIKFSAILGGVDNLRLENISVALKDLTPLVKCVGNLACVAGKKFGAWDTKVTPAPATATFTNTPTATATNTPTPTATPAGVFMNKVPSLANLWLTKLGCTWDANGNLLTGDPVNGKGCLEIDVLVTGAVDAIESPNDTDTNIEGVGAWEHQIRFDHKFISLTPVPDNTWLEQFGRIAHCDFSVVAENSILEGCVTKNPVNPLATPPVATVEPGPSDTGPDLIERIFVMPNINDLIYRSDFRATKDNGIMVDIVDDNCELTDTLGEKLSSAMLPGQLTTGCGDAHVLIRMLECDLNLDCTIDVKDDQAEAFRYGSQLGLQGYDRWFDLEPSTSDDDVDIKDLQFCFGRNYSSCAAPIPDDQGVPPTPVNDP